ncbi:putative N-acetyltransferase ESCO, zinc-finger [Helianthus annuus]|nr:putative N-acetyltransferase ESCO, zinc-finger [Helianthus annuus]
MNIKHTTNLHKKNKLREMRQLFFILTEKLSALKTYRKATLFVHPNKLYQQGQPFSKNIYVKRKNDDDGIDEKKIMNCKSVLNKKRKYAQFHLDLGQSDFMFRNCKICGMKFVPGDEDDERLHKEFHKSYTHGIGLKGWCKERVLDTHSSQNGRVILVQNDYPPAHIKKVEEVIKMMEMELGDGWIFHKDCKVSISTIFLI